MALISVVSGVIRTEMPPLAQATERETGLPWWGWVLIVIISAWLLIRWLSRRTAPANERPTSSISPSQSSGLEPAAGARAAAVVEVPPAPVVEAALGGVVEMPPEPVSAVVEAPAAPVVEPVPAAVVESPPEPAPVRPDDLTIVEGIGSRIAALLVGAGIRTFAQLAATDVDRLRQMLHEVGYRVNDPTTWPEQARLAAAGEWDRLKALQDELKGGRRV